jgi:hypothetical protein
MLNATRRHDKLLRRYLEVTRERAEAQLAGSSSSRVQRLAVRERALAGAVRSIRLHLGLPDTFDPELESARLGIDGKRPEPPSTRVRPVPISTHVDGVRRAVTVTDLLDFVAAHPLDPDSEIVVRRLDGCGHTHTECGGVNVVALGLTDDGRVQLDIAT